jgi:outer membrane lipoprotein-sorting protein
MIAFVGWGDWGSMATAENMADAVPDSVTASVILHRVAALYAATKTYQDSGVVTLRIEGAGAGGGLISNVPFKTAYRAPDQFRFEFNAPHPRMIPMPSMHWIIYRNGKKVEQWAFSKTGTQGSLNRALAGATGVSSAAAHTIPALLMPEVIGGRKITDGTGASLLSEAACSGSICFRVQEGSSGQAQSTKTIWIDRTLLVRRIDAHLPIPDHAAIDTATIYRPVINEPVADAALKFDAPTGILGEWLQYLLL